MSQRPIYLDDDGNPRTNQAAAPVRRRVYLDDDGEPRKPRVYIEDEDEGRVETPKQETPRTVATKGGRGTGYDPSRSQAALNAVASIATPENIGGTVGGLVGARGGLKGATAGAGVGGASAHGLKHLYGLVTGKPLDHDLSVGDLVVEGGKQAAFEGLGGIAAKGVGAASKLSGPLQKAGGYLASKAANPGNNEVIATLGALGAIGTGGLSLPLLLKHPLAQKAMGKGAQAAGRAVAKVKPQRSKSYTALARLLGLAVDEEEEEEF